MSDFIIIDRRLSSKGKNLPNRARFIERNRGAIAKRVRESIKNKSITDTKGTDVTISDGIDEPVFDFDRTTGQHDFVIPGNTDYNVGDVLSKPKGGGQGKGNKAGKGEGEDEFSFALTEEEYLDFIFDGLELPDLVKESEKAAVATERHRAGFSTNGPAAALDLQRSFRNSYGRRIALKFPLARKIKELEARIEALLLDDLPDLDQLAELRAELAALKSRYNAIPFVDPIDVRYRRYEQHPLPNYQAVMFCVMDVSGSMGEDEKERAKRFYLLLYLFLKRSYKKVEVVFIRHTETAAECTEEQFFRDKLSGGTLYSPATQLVNDIVDERYPPSLWNVYACHASDGDNNQADNDATDKIMQILLPKMQMFMVLHTTLSYQRGYGAHIPEAQSMWDALASSHKNFVQHPIDYVEDVMDVFRKAFAKKRA